MNRDVIGEGVRDVLRFVLVGLSGTVARYLYYPEGRDGASGSVEFDMSTGRFEVTDESPDDYRSYYANHLRSRLSGVSSQDELPRKGIVAWY